MIETRVAANCRRVGILLLAALGLGAPAALAQAPGTLDTSFFGDGSVGATDIAGYPSALPIAVADAAGRLVIGEAVPASNGAMVLRRIGDDGAQLIRHIAVFVGGSHRASAITRLPSGGFVVVGMAAVSANRYLFVTRLSADLAVDTSFGSGGFATRYWGGISIRNADVAVATDGSIYVVGGTTASSGGNASFLIRWSSTGVRTYEFLEMEYGNDETIARVLPTSDGKILLAGWTRSSSPNEGNLAPVTSTWFVERRFAASGLIDGSFGSFGKAVINWPVLAPEVRYFSAPAIYYNQLGGAVRDGFGRSSSRGRSRRRSGRCPTSCGSPRTERQIRHSAPTGSSWFLLGPGAETSGAQDVAFVLPVGLPPALLLWGSRCPESSYGCEAVLHARALDGSFYPGFGTDAAWSRTPVDRFTLGVSSDLVRIDLGRLAITPLAAKVYAALRLWDDTSIGQPPAPPVSLGLRFWRPYNP